MVDGALKGINVDSRVAEQVRQNVVSQPNRYAFDVAEVCSHWMWVIFALIHREAKFSQKQTWVNSFVAKIVHHLFT